MSYAAVAAQMESYINNTRMKPNERYDLYHNEILAIYVLLRADLYRGICLAFNYGKAKGYRMALAKKKKGTA